MTQFAGRILIVEDDPQIQKLFKRKLSLEGYDIIAASNGQQGLELYHKELADLVLTDILMPEKDGIEMIIELKKKFPDAKIIAISGGGRNDPNTYLQLARHLGAKRIFAKPVKWPELIEAVHALIN